MASTLVPPTAASVVKLPPDLLDAIDSVVISASGQHGRSTLVFSLLTEVYNAIAWLGPAECTDEELQSLRLILDASEAHRARRSGSADQ